MVVEAGLSNQETRYRQRYLDGIVNHQHVRKIFDTRAKIIQKIRRFFDERDFMEVCSLKSPPLPSGALRSIPCMTELVLNNSWWCESIAHCLY